MDKDIMDGPLVAASGGAEQPFTVNGRRWLYCWHPRSNRHCYLDLDNDRPVWNRSFHPAFHPELEFESERQPPPRKVRPTLQALPNYNW